MNGNINALLQNWLFFLIDNENDKVCLDYKCWYGLNDDILFDEYESEFDELKNQQFDITRTHFNLIVKSTPYMFIENIFFSLFIQIQRSFCSPFSSSSFNTTFLM